MNPKTMYINAKIRKLELLCLKKLFIKSPPVHIINGKLKNHFQNAFTVKFRMFLVYWMQRGE